MIVDENRTTVVNSCFSQCSGAEGLRVEFDRQCSTERRHDPLTIMDGAGRTVSIRSGKLFLCHWICNFIPASWSLFIFENPSMWLYS